MAAIAKRGARAAARETWITNPDALLAALSSAEEAELARRSPPPPVPEARSPHVMQLCVPVVHEEPERALALRENERIARPSARGDVIVIIRRRRAA